MNLDDFKTTLGEKSANDQNKKPLIDSDIPVYDFDEIKNHYVSKNLNLFKDPKIKGPRSVDALYHGKEKNVLFEFKSGSLSSKDIFEIHTKIYDSFMILCDLFDEHLTCTLNKEIFVLVFDDEKDAGALDKKFLSIKTNYSSNNSMETISNYVMDKANEHLVKFNLIKYKGYLFQDVYTIPKTKFDHEIKKIIP